MHYLEKGKPNLSWTFFIRATHMCQTLRLHQDVPFESETQSHESRHRGVRLFWAVCLMEKWLAMSLGRPSTLRSDEITAPKDWEDYSDTELGMGPVIRRWIDISILQDRVYDDIYSPSALSQPDDVRVEKARNLAAELRKAFESIPPLEARQKETSVSAEGQGLTASHFTETIPSAIAKFFRRRGHRSPIRIRQDFSLSHSDRCIP